MTAKKETARADNRAAFPATAAIMDEFRAEFGDGVKLVCAEENGKKIGKFPPPPERFMNADQWLKGSRLVAEELERRAVKPELNERRRGRS